MRNTHISKQTSNCSAHVIRRIFEIFLTSNNEILLDAQINEYIEKLSTTPNAYDTSQDNRNTTPKAPQLDNLQKNHPLSLVPSLEIKQ